MSSSPVPIKTRRVGQRCTLNLSRAETSSRWCGVVVATRTDPKHCACASAKRESVSDYLSTREVDFVCSATPLIDRYPIENGFLWHSWKFRQMAVKSTPGPDVLE
ncbi:hypothetical protein TNCV_1056221 [Trichonephila clavipes]|nr:hypothetical protein TNCV_1056221 [Trichonephila clavipes]